MDAVDYDMVSQLETPQNKFAQYGKITYLCIELNVLLFQKVFYVNDKA
jgi:hypothetical protein